MELLFPRGTIQGVAGNVRYFSFSSRYHPPITSSSIGNNIDSLKHFTLESSSYSSYFKYLSNILSDSLKTDLEKQKMLEDSLIQYISQHIDTDNRFINKNKGVMLNFNKGSVKDVILYALETYNLHNKNGFIKEIAQNLGDRDVLCILMITYGLIISYYTKLGYTNIAAVIGRKILEFMYLYKSKYRVLKTYCLRYY